jgi:glycosyltransferase involved in cell wall biosynthesis
VTVAPERSSSTAGTSAAPRFSVVIPAFNAAATIASAVGSVLRQTETDFELVVVDDGSTDATGQTVSEISDPRVRLLSQANCGLPAARNRAIAASKGRYVSFLDSDDLWLPEFLEHARQAIGAGAGVGFAYTDAYAFEASTGKVRRGSAMVGSSPPVPPPTDPHEFLYELLQRNFVYVSTTVPRSVLDEVGAFNEGRTASEDYDLWLRILAGGYRAVHMPGRHALYRLHAGQMSRDEANLKRNELAIYNGLRIEDMPTEAHRELLLQRRRQAAQELRIAQGELRLALAVRRVRYRLGAAKRRLGVGGYAWCSALPPELASTYPDLKRV